MSQLQTTYSETLELKLALALMLFDGFSGQNRLVGNYERGLMAEPPPTSSPYTTVRLAGPGPAPFQKVPSATFLFVGLPDGAHTIQTRSPYYQPRDIMITLPMPVPRWPAFPDVTLANEDLPLQSPNQPAAYRAQRRLATLLPTTSYPFPGDATLVRGSVRYAGNGLAGATVRRVGGDGPEYVTEVDGGFVLFFFDIPRGGQLVTLQATHPLHPTATVSVRSVGGETVTRDIAMA
jgi:hypothetical protein